MDAKTTKDGTNELIDILDEKRFDYPKPSELIKRFLTYSSLYYHQQNRELMRGLKDLLCIKDNIYQEVMQFGSLSLKGKESMLRCFAESGQQMLMVYDSRVIPYLVKEILLMPKAETQIKIYLFADGAYPYTEDFATVMDKVQLIPMPYAYLRSIKYSLPEANPSWADNTDLTEDEQQEMMAEAISYEEGE